MIKKILILVVFMIAQPIFSFAKDKVIVLGNLDDPTVSTTIDAINAQIRRLGKHETMPLQVVKMKMRAKGNSTSESLLYADAVSLSKDFNADILLWIEPWHEFNTAITIKKADLKKGITVFGVGRLLQAHDPLRPYLAKGVATALLEGENALANDEGLRSPMLKSEPDWGSWTGGRYSPNRFMTSMLFEISTNGKPGRNWVLRTSSPSHAERYDTMLKKYRFLPTEQEGEPVLSFGIIDEHAGSTRRKPITFPGESTLWAYIVLVQDEGRQKKAETKALYQDALSRLSEGKKHFFWDECIRKKKKVNPDTSGGITVDLTIDESGSVTKSTLKYSSMNEPDTQECILEDVGKWKFPKPPSSISPVTFEMRYHVSYSNYSVYQCPEEGAPWIYWTRSSRQFDAFIALDQETITPWTIKYNEDKKHSQGVFLGTEREGPWKYWHDNEKNSAEGKYNKGKKVGHWTSWYYNGNKLSEGEYKAGLKTGKWTVWHNLSQKMKVEGNYIDGKADGLWTYWNKGGVRIQRITFKNGIRVE